MNANPSPDADLHLLERILRFHEDGLTLGEMARLEREIRTEPHKRRLFIETQQRSLVIRSRFVAQENRPSPAPLPLGTWRSLLCKPAWSAAAGLMLGLLSASLVSGESFPFPAKLLFETRLYQPDQPGPPPPADPTSPGSGAAITPRWFRPKTASLPSPAHACCKSKEQITRAKPTPREAAWAASGTLLTYAPFAASPPRSPSNIAPRFASTPSRRPHSKRTRPASPSEP